MSDERLLTQIIRPDERFFWSVTGSIRDLKFSPLLWMVVFGLAAAFIPMARKGFLESWCWLIVAAISFLPMIYYKRRYHSYTLTDKRLIIISGILTKSVDEIELFRVVDSTVSQSVADVWANLGSLTVTSNDATGTIKMKKVPNPNQLRESLREAYIAARNAKGTVVMESMNGGF